jgi:preprotein translocase subunit SecG
MTLALTILHILVAIALIGIVLVQEGNDGGISGAIGGMTQSAITKKKGFQEKLVRLTIYIAGAFLLTAIIILLV